MSVLGQDSAVIGVAHHKREVQRSLTGEAQQTLTRTRKMLHSTFKWHIQPSHEGRSAKPFHHLNSLMDQKAVKYHIRSFKFEK